MTTADDYVNRLLDRMPLAMPRRAQIGAELRSHIAERMAAGSTLDEVLRQLGDPIALAESYLAEEPLVPAPYGRRIGAKLVDVMLFFMGFALILITGYAIASTADAFEVLWILPLFGIIAFSVSFVAYVIVAEWHSGQTIGKRLFGLRVVRESGARISLGQSVVRQLPSLFQVFWIDAAFALFTDRRQRAFELLSKTRVVDATGWDGSAQRTSAPADASDPGLRTV